jgi:hypothetical protein
MITKRTDNFFVKKKKEKRKKEKKTVDKFNWFLGAL